MTIKCPLCNSDVHSKIYERLPLFDDLSLVRCKQCLHVYTFTKREFDNEQIYNDEVYKVVENRNSVFDKILTREYKGIINKLDRLKPLKGSLLDFGSGKGKFSWIAQKKGWKVKAVETAKERAEYARKIYGLDVMTEPYTSGKIGQGDFDVIALLHVLEHLEKPKSLLEELITQNIKKDGFVLIEVPNFNSLQRKIAGKRWLHLDAGRHISHFSSTRLSQLAAELELELISSSSLSFHLGVLGMTDSLLKVFGYRKNIIEQLKNKKPFSLVAGIVLLLPVAILLEVFAAGFGNAGITRKYFKKKTSRHK